MNFCSAIKKDGLNCTNKAKHFHQNQWYYGLHLKNVDNMDYLTSAMESKLSLKSENSGGRSIGDLNLFNNLDQEAWEQEYQKIMDLKYKKNTRNYSTLIHGKEWTHSELPPIYLVPRVRGESYKEIRLYGIDNNDDVYYAPISKGYSMGDLSSFTLGPVVGSGLCLVNAAFSKKIMVSHIEGGGKFNTKGKIFGKQRRTQLDK